MENKIDVSSLKPKYHKTISLEKICKWLSISTHKIPYLQKYQDTIFEETKKSENKQIKKN